ncbi:HNH endonuclease [Nocardiopsis sp. N85]|uniref:HNH endonuclease n=1 Tax=Nocardiopsis sp. N85 TaxID=3029400 RepID=UPI00237F02A3|nr:HNH endonuclease [Nocardiopsis sp. N85]MDE3720652.1 HNH endonuclease [Nocardiopsis sp. N85]
MIRLGRTGLPADLAEKLTQKTDELTRIAADGETARSEWKSAGTCRKGVREQLDLMAAGINRCMYRGDSMGTDIDHFEPLFLAPLRAFSWPNHLLACSHCNSHEERETFPRDSGGDPLLIDPTSDEPTEHLRLAPSTGEYQGMTPQGRETIEVFGLNRTSLTLGRRAAFVNTKNILRSYLRQCEEGLVDQASETATAFGYHPFADVRETMLWIRGHIEPEPARIVLGGRDIVRALDLLSPP